MPQILEFDCPHCRAHLRSKDRTLVGREIPCPECRQAIRIVDREDGSLQALPLAGPAPPKGRSAGPSRWTIRVAVTTTLALCGGLLFFVLREKGPGESNASPSPPPAAAPSAPVPAAPPAPVATDDSAAKPEPLAAQRLQQLGDWIGKTRIREGAWPLGLTGDEMLALEARLSWLAELAGMHIADGTPPPTLSLPWNAPENDRFVRRRLAPFQRPDAPSAGEDRYPAAHFVGIAGVGADAPTLPKSHPRAGIWGFERRTTVEDVRDGLSNTFLVLGREGNLHSWAHGTESVRGLTAEPYFGGPDGFGTGQPDGMFALLADGSVRFLSRETAPVVMRRYAAMADGFSLDPAVAGDPLDLHPVTPTTDSKMPASPGSVPAPAAAVAAEDQAPILPQLAADLPTIDIAKALAQSLREYRIEKPVPTEEILYELRELMAIPLDWSAFPQDEGGPLRSPWTISLPETTVGGVLEAVAEHLEAEILREPFGVRLVPRAKPAAL